MWCGVVWCGVVTRDGRDSLLQGQLLNTFIVFSFLVEKFQELVLFVCVVCV